MKPVNAQSVRERIDHLELQAQIGGRLPIRHEFEMACLRELSALQQKLDALVALVENVDNSHCMCGAEIDKKYGCGCGYTVGMFDYHYGKWSEKYGSSTHDTADKAG